MPEENIFFFVPNLIGYARVVLALLSFYLMPCCPWPAIFCYLLSALLDAFDGHAARALNQFWSHVGHADRPLRHHVSAGQPVINLPLLHLPLPAQHVFGHRQPLAAPAQFYSKGINEPQNHRPLRQPHPPNLLHIKAGAVCDVRWERALFLSALPPPSHRGTRILALLAAGALLRHLPAEVRHQPRAPRHRLAEHGRDGRRRAGEGREGAVRGREGGERREPRIWFYSLLLSKR